VRAFSSRCRVQLVGQVCRIVPASLPPAACGIHAAANARINTAQLITRTCDVSFERALTAKSCKNYIVTLINGVTRVFVLGPVTTRSSTNLHLHSMLMALHTKTSSQKTSTTLKIAVCVSGATMAPSAVALDIALVL